MERDKKNIFRDSLQSSVPQRIELPTSLANESGTGVMINTFNSP